MNDPVNGFVSGLKQASVQSFVVEPIPSLAGCDQKLKRPMSAFQTLDQLDVRGKTVLVRGDLNVPMADGKVTDTTRLDRLVPTIDALTGKGAKVVLLSHFGRPKRGADPRLSLKPVADAFSHILAKPVAFASDCIGPVAQSVVQSLPPGGVAVLENVRFHEGEESNDPSFAKALAALGDVFVNDAFSSSHRAHASVEAITHLLPSAAGRGMQAELEALSKALEKPQRPVMAVVGGAKISTKLELLGNLVSKVDQLVLGGGMANTFLFAKGVKMGISLCEKDMAEQARTIMAQAETAGCEIVLPIDAVVAREFKQAAPNQVVAIDAVPDDFMVLDLGPASVRKLAERLNGVKTVVWNGPLGAFEIRPFDQGTNAVAEVVASLTEGGSLVSVAGGGDTVAALAAVNAESRFTYVSTAGGAFLEWLEGKTLPGVEALEKSARTPALTSP
jgi:phosphoglycerate kinase